MTRWDKDRERERKRAYREKKKREVANEPLPAEVVVPGEPHVEKGVDKSERPKDWVPVWAKHVRAVLHAAAIEAADEESESRRLKAMREPPNTVVDTGSEKEGPPGSDVSWAERRRRNAISYANFIMKNRATDPLYGGYFQYGLPPRMYKRMGEKKAKPIPDEVVAALYGYYRREPGHAYPGVADLPA